MTEYEILLLLDPDLDEARQSDIVARTREASSSVGASHVNCSR